MIAEPGQDDPGQDPAVAAVLTARIASSLVHHEPGWRLPRNTTLARRYNVSTAQIDAAIGELVARHLLRRLPDGQVYRASPAEYLITLDGLPGPGTRIDPMGASITRASRHESHHRRIPQDIAHTLGMQPGQQALIIRCLWEADREPAALSTTYLPPGADTGTGDPELSPASLDAALNSQPPGHAAGRPAAMCVELQPPVPSIARSLRLAPGEPAITITVAFSGPEGCVAALTTAVLRASMFRVVVESAPGALLPALSQAGRSAQGQAP